MLRLEDVTISYEVAREPAVRGVSIEVAAGALVTLIGANGAGKTTTLKAIAGLLRPRAGAISFDGQRLDRLPAEAVVGRGISLVPEGRRVFTSLTVYDNLRAATHLIRDGQRAKRNIDTALERFPRLAERRGQMAGTLSGGEQQMLAIARALITEPKVLLLDEPSLGLAPQLVEEVGDLVVELNRQGLAILLVEQNAVLALSIASYGYVLETGRIVLEGPGRDLLANPQVQDAYLGGDLDAAQASG